MMLKTTFLKCLNLLAKIMLHSITQEHKSYIYYNYTGIEGNAPQLALTKPVGQVGSHLNQLTGSTEGRSALSVSSLTVLELSAHHKKATASTHDHNLKPRDWHSHLSSEIT